MKLIRIEIENYRGIKDKQTIGISDFTTIVGKNDSGKSIILHAIASFLDNNEFMISEDDFNFYRESDSPIEITCYFEDDDLKRKLSEFIKENRKKDIGVEEEIESIIQNDNQIVVKKTWYKPDKKSSKCELRINDFEEEKYRNLSQKNDGELNKILDDLGIRIPPDHPGRNSKLEKAKFIKKYLQDNNYKKVFIWREEPKIDKLLPKIEFFQADHVISTTTEFNTSLKAETKEYFQQEQALEESKLKQIESETKKQIQREASEITKYMQMHVKDLEKVEMDPVFDWVKAISNIKVSFKFSKDKRPIPMENKGAGYRRLFMVGRFRYLAAKKSDQDIIYMIEEPETFLHPSAQQELLDSLIKISENNQVLITTHSPIFAGATEKSKIILCKEESQSKYYQKEKGIIEEIINELGIKPFYNLRDSFEKIIFVEGFDDIEFIKIATKKLLDKDLNSSPYKKKLLFLPGGGSTLSNFVNIEYFKKESKRSLFLICDGDNHDKRKHEQNKKLVEEFNKNSNCKGFLLKKSTIENYYHPRAIERKYKLNDREISCDLFSDNENVIDVLKRLKERLKINIKIKGNLEIFEEMSQEEWKKVLDDKLKEIIKEIIGDL